MANLAMKILQEQINELRNEVAMLKDSSKVLQIQKGLSIGTRHISISTSGLVPRIYDLANENIQCTNLITKKKKSPLISIILLPPG